MDDIYMVNRELEEKLRAAQQEVELVKTTNKYVPVASLAD